MLFHVSEDAGIRVFTPRRSTTAPEPVVWAIDADHLRNYLLPRNCPRVTYAAGPHTTAGDGDRFLRTGRPVVAIETTWVERAQRAQIACYRLPDESFELQDATAGYFVSRQSVVPDSVELIQDPVARLRASGVELQVLPNLWSLHDAVAASTLEFSMIRMRMAQPRP
jgi:hypothetical protein